MNPHREKVAAANSPFTPVLHGLLQRKYACGNHTPAGGECEECSNKKQTLQRAGLSQQGRKMKGETEVHPVVHEVLRSPGQPLDPTIRTFFESRFGHDFSHVRVHTDAKAIESARAVDALAYTVGRDVVFGAGQYVPRTSAGRRLLAHELTHVVQQEGSVSGTSALRIADPESRPEREANAAAARLISDDIAAGVPLSSSLQGGLYRQQADEGAFPASPPAVVSSLAATGAVQAIKVWVHSFIPMASIKDPFGYCYAGDNRGFSNAIHASYRTHQEIEIDVATGGKTIDWVDVGTTHELDGSTCTTVISSAKASTSGLMNGPIISTGTSFRLNFNGSAKNPKAWYACSIDYKFNLIVNSATRRCTLDGEHDGFPAYEVYVTANGGAGVPVYTYNPTAVGEGATALCGGLDKTASGRATF